MRKFHLAIVVAAAFLAQPVLADQDMSDDSKPCASIAKACMDAGYSQGSTDKRFWKDCMKPVILGQSVKDVNIDSDTVKMCRADKIAQMKKELEELKKAFSSNTNVKNSTTSTTTTTSTD